MLKAGSKLLFQGDSITDAGRNHEHLDCNTPSGLSFGYAGRAAGAVLAARPADKLGFYNRGISGNRIVDLYARWRTDGINIKPDVISILAGVNDTWHTFTTDNGVEVERFETVYRMLIDYTLEQLPETKFILCEPFVLLCGVVEQSWLDDVAKRQEAVKRVAADYQAVHVPFQSLFNELEKQAEPAYWLFDGVHPSAAGHQAMADFWREKTGI